MCIAASLTRSTRNSHWQARVHRRKPSIAVRRRAVDNPKELFLQPLGDGAALACADGDAILGHLHQAGASGGGETGRSRGLA